MSGSTPSASNCTDSFLGLLDCNSGLAAKSDDISLGGLIAALVVSFVSLGVQTLGFLILRLKLTRIYRPRSYLVAERERVPQPPGGLIGWLYPLFTTTNLTIIQKCGLDAYFFLRYLRMLLKIFFPLALLLLPILLPINATADGDKSGLDQLSISNVVASKEPNIPGSRLWAHCILGVVAILWILYVITHEFREYIRVRQAFLASPQHRIRASATTVLVTGIPRKWLTHAALSGLYDVYPGGIRNIWINRNYDELADKVKLRDKAAKGLESAETNLIKLCRKKNEKAKKKRQKKEGGKSRTKQELKQDRDDEDQDAEQLAASTGISAGAQQQTRQDLEQIAGENVQQRRRFQNGVKNPLAAVGQSFGVFGKGVARAGGRVVGTFDSGVKKTNDNFTRFTDAANTGPLGGGFAAEDSIYKSPSLSDGSPITPRPNSNAFPAANTNALRLEVVHEADHEGAPVDDHTVSPLDAHLTPVSMQDQSFSPALPPFTPNSEAALRRSPSLRTVGPSGEGRPKSLMEIEEPNPHHKPNGFWSFLRDKDTSIVLPSPIPHTEYEDDDEFPLYSKPDHPTEPTKNTDVSKSKFLEGLMIWRQKKKSNEDTKEAYPVIFSEKADEDEENSPRWLKYIKTKDRETMRLPLFGLSWLPSLPFLGKKVDRIYHLRRELARLNLEIEFDQKDTEKFPLMNSAFIQFNHQIAAHMCCQSLSHHLPQQMAPRLVEISPDDVVWDNMSVKWWERLLRIGVTSVIGLALIVLYAIPVAFTGLLSNVSELTELVPWLGWLDRAPTIIINIIQGVLPALLLNLILWLVPLIFGVLIKQQGVPTGNAKQQGMQAWYFTFLFIQVFFVVSISSGLTKFFSSIASNPTSIVSTLATDLPQSADYFFSYLTIQAMSTSASALLQAGSLISWFLLAPILDSTARAKWRRETKLSTINWGTFFPAFTNFAAIGIIYSVLAPLILVFMLLIFGLFWIVYRYNVLYVKQFRHDTGGLLFPTALNQLFVGLYFMELCLIGIFFTTTENGNVVCIGQAVIMIAALVATILYQWGLNNAFKPLFQYLPITLEDEAVVRDEQFAKAQASKFAPLVEAETSILHEDQDDNGKHVRPERETSRSFHESDLEASQTQTVHDLQTGETRDHTHSEEVEMQELGTKDVSSKPDHSRPWHMRSHSESKFAAATGNLRKVGPEAVARLRYLADGRPIKAGNSGDVEAQKVVGDVLYSGFADELEDMTPADRDLLVRYAFQHSALRARRPVVWIPRDRLGVSDDEIKRAKKMSTTEIEDADGAKEEKTYIWMSNEGTALNHKGNIFFRRNPPDFSAVDLVSL